MKLEGILKINRHKNSTLVNDNNVLEFALDRCYEGVKSIKDYSNEDYYGFSFTITNVLCVDTILTNVSKFSKGSVIFRVIRNGVEIDISMLK